MVEEFENTVWKMNPGQISDIFATRFGFHIVRLIERKAAAPYDLEEVEDHVRETIRRQMSDEAVEKFLDSLREKATVEEA
jgi:parvulin-like peptidyl-prolyl isomerase